VTHCPSAPRTALARTPLVRAVACGIVVGGVGGLGGCVPDPPSTFQSLAPNDRLDAIVEASGRTDHESLLGLVEQLDSDDPAARVLAIAALRKRTGKNFGYESADPAWRREPAVQQWREYAESGAGTPDGSAPGVVAESDPTTENGGGDG